MFVILVVLEQTVILNKESRLNEVAIQTDNEGKFTHIEYVNELEWYNKRILKHMQTV